MRGLYVKLLNGHRSAWTPAAVAGMLYLALVVVAAGFMAWNYAIERVEAPRAAMFLNLQPLVGAALGVAWLGERVTLFTVVGGALILGGLHIAVRRQRECWEVHA